MHFGAGESVAVEVPASVVPLDPEYGSAPEWDYDNPAETFELVDVAVDDSKTMLFAAPGRLFPTSDFVVYVPPGQRATESHHVVIVRGKRTKLDGDPVDWRDPFDGTPWGVVLGLKRVPGGG